MSIIAFKNYEGNCMSGFIKIEKGMEFTSTIHETKECVCCPDGRLIAFVYSIFYTKCLARNDDGQGLIRGPLVYLITHTSYTPEQSDILLEKWSKYLQPNGLFNILLYEAPINILQDIIGSLNLKEGQECIES